MAISRRSLLIGATAAGAAAFTAAAQKRVRVAAIQLHPKLADVSANLVRSEQLIREAISRQAEWIVLPEFFTSGLAFDPVNLPDSPRPLDGAPTQMLKRMAREGQAAVGGAFLARSGPDVFNTFVLALPTGDIFTHDKDFPTTSMESSLYAGGEDDEFVKAIEAKGVATVREIVPSRPGNTKSGVLRLPDRSVGVAMCWEQVRFRTAHRMRGLVDLVLTASKHRGGSHASWVRPSFTPASWVPSRVRRPWTEAGRGRCSFPARARLSTATAKASRFATSPKARASSWAKSNRDAWRRRKRFLKPRSGRRKVQATRPGSGRQAAPPGGRSI
jgi:predicted amidohydrolase